MRLPESRQASADAVALRAWAARRLLAGERAAPPAAGAGSWRLFLRAERCAVLLQESLAAGLVTWAT